MLTLVTIAYIMKRQGEAWRMRIDKAGLFCYKHNVLAIERLGGAANACEDAWGGRWSGVVSASHGSYGLV